MIVLPIQAFLPDPPALGGTAKADLAARRALRRAGPSHGRRHPEARWLAPLLQAEADAHPARRQRPR